MKSLEDYKARKSARVRMSAKVKEVCHVSRNQNPKSLDDLKQQDEKERKERDTSL
jgi:hypothetical protein